MRKPTWLDWLGATVLWFGASVMAGVFVTEGLDFPEELGVTLFLTMFAGGVAAARIRWLRQPEAATTGLTTGEAQLTRLEEIEVRLGEMERAPAAGARAGGAARLLGTAAGQRRPSGSRWSGTMARPTTLDWLGAGIIWTGATFFFGFVLARSGGPAEAVIPIVLGTWSVGLAGARIWWLRRSGASGGQSPRVGLSTGEMTAQRLADMEARIYELEERLELTERLLEQARERPRLPLIREDTPV